MAYRIIEFVATPNPNALKCVLDVSPAPNGPRSYVNKAPDAAADPLGAALMQIAGIRNILIHDGWISIGKDPAADWRSLKAAVKKVLSEAS